MIDETRIERALRQGPPFATDYVPVALPVGLDVQRLLSPTGGSLGRTQPMRIRPLGWVSIATVLLLAAVLGGVALIGSGAIELRGFPTPRDTSGRAALIANEDPFDWLVTGSLLTPRAVHTATRLQDGRVLVVGGAGSPRGPGEYEALASAELYDPVTRTWTPAANLAHGRLGHSATLLRDGHVLVSGGVGSDGTVVRTAEVYDPAIDTWREIGGSSDAFEGQTATLLLDGTVLVVGGQAHGSGASGESSAAEVYDPVTETWTPVAEMRVGRTGHGAALLPDGRVLVAGGWNGFGRLASAELYDPVSRTWSPTGDLPETYNAPATTLLDGTVLLVGGDWSKPSGAVGSSHAALYDPDTGSWTTAMEMGTPRLAHSATLLSDGRVLVAGGQVGGGASSGRYASGEVYDPAMRNWAVIDDMNHARSGHTATLLADGSVLVAGGWADDCADGPDCPFASAELLVATNAP